MKILKLLLAYYFIPPICNITSAVVRYLQGKFKFNFIPLLVKYECVNFTELNGIDAFYLK